VRRDSAEEAAAPVVALGERERDAVLRVVGRLELAHQTHRDVRRHLIPDVVQRAQRCPTVLFWTCWREHGRRHRAGREGSAVVGRAEFAFDEDNRGDAVGGWGGLVG